MEFRANTRVGLWVCPLIPIAMILNDFNVYTSHKIVVNFALHLSFYSLLFALSSLKVPPLKSPNNPKKILQYIEILSQSPSTKIFKTNINFKPVIASILIMTFTNLAFGAGLFGTILCLFGYCGFVYILPQWFSVFKGSFSYGEGCLALQSVLIFMLKSVLSEFFDEQDPTTVDGSFNIFATVGLFSLCLLCVISFLPVCYFVSKSTAFYVTGASLICGLSIPYLWWQLKRNPITWLLNHILTSKNLIILVITWGICAVFAISLVLKQSSQASTAIRKYFHALIVIVYTSGILTNFQFLYLASIVSLCVMVLLEFMRFKSIQPVATWLKNAFKLFQDEKDQGALILTNIYLLSGVSLPVWIDLDKTPENLVLFSGVLSIGIGDAFASIVGSKFGKIKLFATQKTLEGFFASVLSQIVFLKGLEICGLLVINANFIILIFLIMIVSLVEAVTTQVDNIVLPLVMYIFMKSLIKLT